MIAESDNYKCQDCGWVCEICAMIQLECEICDFGDSDYVGPRPDTVGYYILCGFCYRTMMTHGDTLAQLKRRVLGREA